MSRIIWTQSALDDLTGIRDYIARDSVYYADKFVNDALRSVERLEVFPSSGRMVVERNSPDLREIGFGAYRIIYKIIDGDVYIITMVHGKRNFIPE